jgi:hypothetical protein
MASYQFLTTWLIEADRERVWDAIYDSERWPEWWKGVEEATKLEEGDDTGIGQFGRYVWKAKLPIAFSSSSAPPAWSGPICSRGCDRGTRRCRALATVRGERADRGDLRVERAHDEAVDEPARPGRPTRLPEQPRLCDA